MKTHVNIESVMIDRCDQQVTRTRAVSPQHLRPKTSQAESNGYDDTAKKILERLYLVLELALMTGALSHVLPSPHPSLNNYFSISVKFCFDQKMRRN